MKIWIRNLLWGAFYAFFVSGQSWPVRGQEWTHAPEWEVYEDPLMGGCSAHTTFWVEGNMGTQAGMQISLLVHEEIYDGIPNFAVRGIVDGMPVQPQWWAFRALPDGMLIESDPNSPEISTGLLGTEFGVAGLYGVIEMRHSERFVLRMNVNGEQYEVLSLIDETFATSLDECGSRY